MGPGGATALSATGTPHHPRISPDMPAVRARSSGRIALTTNPARPPCRLVDVPLDHEHASAPVRYRLSTSRLVTRSSPGGLSGLAAQGGLVLEGDSHLDAFSGSPVRT